MNLPNKLTVLRIALVPFFVFFLLTSAIANNYLFAIAVFILASITDHLDGKLARKNNQVTDFGKFLDPLADKVLVVSALICFVELGFLSSIPVIIILFREFMVTSIRLMAVAKGRVIAASIWGKLKTISQITAILAILSLKYIFDILKNPHLLDVFPVIANILVWITVIFSLLSGFFYICDNIDLIKDLK